jgi:predicted acyltransferase
MENEQSNSISKQRILMGFGVRNLSIDALRGLAILAMILSGSIAFGDTLPAFMYHAQVPPPLHQFNPSLPGITWVDLVFPFFLFSMGAAIPLALKKHVDAGNGFKFIFLIALKRFLLLAFFALFTQHLKAWVVAENPTIKEHLLSMFAFVLLFFQFYENKHVGRQYIFNIIKLLAFIIAIVLLVVLPFSTGKGFDFYKSDIIIMVLANMAFFGTIIYYFTYNKPTWRLALLPFIMAIFLSAKEPANSWVKELYNFSHIGLLKFDWLYKFYFLKYLFIVLPGTLAGEWILYSKHQKQVLQTDKNTKQLLVFISIALIVINLYGLFTRMLFVNFVASTVLCMAAYLLAKKQELLIYKMVIAGSYLLLLGLLLEPYEGGIKKDSSTYSYYFVTSGLAFFTLVFFEIASQLKFTKNIVNYLALNGKNPMVAYVVGSLVILPLLSITGLHSYYNAMNQNAFMGFIKGVLFTSAVSLITIFFVKKGWFWKT